MRTKSRTYIYLTSVFGNTRVQIASGIGFVSFGQLALVRAGVANLGIADYASFLRYVSLTFVITLIFGAPAMNLGVLKLSGNTTLSSAIELLARIISCAMLASSAIAVCAAFLGQWALFRTALFIGLIIFITSCNSAQRGVMASKGEWGSVFKILAVEGGTKLALIITLNYFFDSTNLSYYLGLLVIPQVLASVMFAGKHSPLEILSNMEKVKIFSFRPWNKLLSIWISGSGSVLATVIPVWAVTNSGPLSPNEIKTLATSLFIFRAPMSFSSAILTPFAVEESKNFEDSGREANWNRLGDYLKKNFFRFSTAFAVYGILAIVLLVLFFGFSTWDVIPLGVLVGVSTIFYFVGELVSSFMQTQNKFSYSIFGWAFSTISLWVSFQFLKIDLVTPGFILVFSSGMLILTHYFVINFFKLTPRHIFSARDNHK